MNERLHVMCAFGTRPDAVKMAPLAAHLKACPDIKTTVCVTAQHREMLDGVLRAFNLTPDIDLDIMRREQSLSDVTARALKGMEDAIAKTKPDIVLVHGDTTTAFAGALAALYMRIDSGHVEAGLRTYDRFSPHPEEMNRQMISRLASLHFCPTELNRKALEREGVTSGVYVTGNTVIDAMRGTVRPDYTFQNPTLNSPALLDKKVLLVTAHRRENYGEGLENIFLALRDIAERFEDVLIIYPVHPAPVVRGTASRILDGIDRVVLTAPLEVLDMHNLMARCFMVLTDSGGLQEEAPALGKPVLVLRRETERPEAVEAGTVRLAGIERDNIVRLACELITDKDAYQAMASAVSPYGDGNACARIADALLAWHRGRAK